MVWIKTDGVGNMATQLTSTTTTHDRSRGDPTPKDAVTTSIEKLVDMKTVSTEQQKPALGREQIRALVIDAFDSASNQLHAPNEDGRIMESLLSSANGDAKNDTPAVSVRSAKLVEIDTLDAERNVHRKSQHMRRSLTRQSKDRTRDAFNGFLLGA
ncbi:hypothetical protein NLG97_g9527 [Lecanicillium saksenae]|uniref:Uncharacterized protein n=1 Tax=Lecanicillium saksenae TaxID=468837 RepID=A0ACC1QIR0_9HYPO|nr:hypothetical protein NLG97_g9527 [Lecanicillium saksenae]